MSRVHGHAAHRILDGLAIRRVSVMTTAFVDTPWTDGLDLIMARLLVDAL